MQFSKSHFSAWLRPLTGGWLVGLLLLLNAMAASPELHEFFHADAGKADHECAVTLFAHGQVDSPVVDVATMNPVAPFEFLPQISASVPYALVEALPPGRAPPVSSLHF